MIFIVGRKRNDLLGELAGGRCRGDARSALHDVRILRLAADAVLLRDEVGGLVHRPPHCGHALLQRRVEEAVHVEVEPDEADAAADDDVFNLGGIDAGALDGMTQHVRRHRDAVGLVERTPRGARDAGPTVGDDGDVFHRPTPGCRATVSTSNSNWTDLAITHGDREVRG